MSNESRTAPEVRRSNRLSFVFLRIENGIPILYVEWR